MDQQPLFTPHVTQDIALFALLDDVRLSKMGTHLLDVAEKESVIFEKAELPAGIAIQFRRAANSQKPMFEISEGAHALDLVRALEMFRHTIIVPEIDNTTKAPLAYVFLSVARHSLANVAMFMHVNEPDKVIVERFHTGPEGQKHPEILDEMDRIMKAQFAENGDLRRQMRFDMCAGVYADSLLAGQNDAANALKTLRMFARSKVRLGEAGFTSALLFGALSTSAIVTLGMPFLPLIFGAMAAPVGMRAWKGARLMSEDPAESLKKAYADIRKLAELPFGWGDFLESGALEGYGTEGFAEGLLSKSQQASLKSITRHARRSRTMRAIRTLQTALPALKR